MQQQLQQYKQDLENLKEQHRIELAKNALMVELRVREEVTEEIRRRDKGMEGGSEYGTMNMSMTQVISQMEERMQESMKLMREDFERRERDMKMQIGQLEEEVYRCDHVIETMESMLMNWNECIDRGIYQYYQYYQSISLWMY